MKLTGIKLLILSQLVYRFTVSRQNRIFSGRAAELLQHDEFLVDLFPFSPVAAMSLYDDDDAALTAPKDSSAVTGWGKSASWLQVQQTKSLAAIKKAAAAKASQPVGSLPSTPVIAPVVNLKSSRRSAPIAEAPVDAAPRFFGGDKSVSFYHLPTWTLSQCVFFLTFRKVLCLSTIPTGPW